MKQQHRKIDSDAYVPAALSCAIKIQYPRIPWVKISKMAKRTVSASRFILRAMPPAARVLYFVSQVTMTRPDPKRDARDIHRIQHLGEQSNTRQNPIKPLPLRIPVIRSPGSMNPNLINRSQIRDTGNNKPNPSHRPIRREST